MQLQSTCGQSAWAKPLQAMCWSTESDLQVFNDSDYMMSEDARTPNVHSRQVCGCPTASLVCLSVQ